MNKLATAAHIRIRADRLNEIDKSVEPKDRRPDDDHNAELLNVLARIIEGKPIEKAFGAVGDWGYSSEVGKAMIQKMVEEGKLL